MNVNVIKPQGFCLGVSRALRILDEALNDSKYQKPIYLLGRIIHNDIVVEDLKNKGVIVLDDKNKTKLMELKEIKSGSVVFSAHGVPPIFYEIARQKNLDIIDTTCKNVLKVQAEIKKHLELGYEIIYIGTKGHPEAEGILEISSNIHLISTLNDLESLNIKDDKIYATNQTTLSIYDILDIKNALESKYKNLIYDDKICGATTIRQRAMANQPKADLCIVVGDKHSSNTNKLVKVSEEISHIKTILISSAKELDSKMLEGIRTVNVSSGASTPKEVTDYVISYLRLFE